MAEVQFAHDRAFGLVGIDDLELAFFAHTVQMVPRRDGRGAECAVEPKLPQALAIGCVGAGEHATVVESEHAFGGYDRTGGAGAELRRAPKLLG